ncbi:MAG: 4Fe-4S binding protein [Actinomycetia bacterium]|nr:4Fe-4S binding protein [Actinomycetes bacterium]
MTSPTPKISRWPFGLLRVARIAVINLFRRNVVIQYPKQRYDQPDRSRWAVEQVVAEDGSVICTGCKICEQSCPDHCIKIDVEIRPDKTKFIRSWRYERAACMMCGLCVEACPFNAIRMGHDYELAHRDVAEKRIELLREVEAAGPKKKGAEDA